MVELHVPSEFSENPELLGTVKKEKCFLQQDGCVDPGQGECRTACTLQSQALVLRD